MKCNRMSDSELIATANRAARRALPDANIPELKALRPLFAGAFVGGYMSAFGVGRDVKKKKRAKAGRKE